MPQRAAFKRCFSTSSLRLIVSGFCFVLVLGTASAGRSSVSKVEVDIRDAHRGSAGDRLSPKSKLEVRPANGFGMVKAGMADDAGEFYWAFGRKIRLFRSLEKVVVHARDAVIATSQLDAAQVAEFDLEETVPLFARHIFRARKRLTKQSLNAAMNITGIDPVYINEETGTEMLVTDRFVVRLATGADLKALDAINQAYGVEVITSMHGSNREYICQKSGSSATSILALCEAYHQDPSIEWASPDFVFKLMLNYTPTDPLYPDQWHLNNTGQSGGTPDADVDASEAWDRIDTPLGGDPNIVIAIIDTGVDIDHEDLDDNIYQNQVEANGTPNVDDDNNGYVDDISGWDFYSNDNNPRPTTQPHGTSCAGVAAAEQGNGLGGVGVAFNCSILPVKIVSDNGTFASSTSISDGIRYAADMADVLSNSWGGGGDDSIIHSAIQYAVNTKGKLVFFASGNDADGTNSSPAWIQYTLTGFPGGTYTFKWEYSKDFSVNTGDDTAWLDDITFPGGGTFEGFEGSFPPSGWTTDGDASWTQYTESRHVLGTGCSSAQAGTITHDQSTYLQTTASVGVGNLVYHAWTSSEFDYDFFKLYVNGTEYFSRSGDPTVIYNVGYPARYSECIAVGASTSFDYRSAYSQYDDTFSNVLDIVAPSNGSSHLTDGITTTDITGAQGYSSGNYTSGFGGTSSATPLAAGVAALVLSKNPTLTPAQVQTILENSADEIGCQPYTAHYNKYYANGRVNADNALAAAPPVGPKYTISGTVTLGGSGLIDVAMVGLPSNPVTDANGDYSAEVDSGFSGIVTPIKAGYIFTPDSILYSNVTEDIANQNYTAAFAPDLTPPSPNPMEWAVDGEPNALSYNSIAMTAATATDSNTPPVTYYFECTNDGDANSGWQTSPTYIAGGLSPSAQYTFRVKARDSAAALNETDFSSEEFTTTLAQAPILIDAESFEDNWPPSGWSETRSRWNKESDRAYHGAYSADFDGGGRGQSGDLTTPDLNCSDAIAIFIDFWGYDEGADSGEYFLDYFNGSSWVEITALDNFGQDAWANYQDTITDPQYFKSDFKIRWRVVELDNGEHVYVDSVTVQKQPAPPQYTITASADANGSIDPNGQIIVVQGNDLSFTATPDIGYLVDQWIVDDSNVQTGGTSYTLTNIQENHTVNVAFKQIEYTLTLNTIGSGIVTRVPDQTTYTYGQTVDLTALAAVGWAFDSWSGDLSGSVNPETITMDGNKTVTAIFTPIQYIITALAGSNGLISPTGDVYVNHGDSQLFTASPNTGYEVDRWYVDDELVQTGGYKYTLTNITEPHTINVTFKIMVFAIFGYVLEPDGNTPVADVLLSTDTNDVNAVTDPNGYYQLWVNYNWSGTVTPEKEGFIFEPNSDYYPGVTQHFNDVNYTATMMTFEINGYVLEDDGITAVNDVNISAENGGGDYTGRYGGGAAITDVNGYYQVVVDYNWSGKVTPTKYAYAFEPNNIDYNDVKYDYNDQDYTGTLLSFTISGYIKNFCDVPAEDVLVAASNGAGLDTTDANGFYEVWVGYFWSGTVTPTKNNYTFDPNMTTYIGVLNDQVDHDYLADYIYDLDYDGFIGFGDVAIISENWLETGEDIPGDFYDDGADIVNFPDFADFANVWQD